MVNIDKLVFLLFMLQGIVVSSDNMQGNMKLFRLSQSKIFLTPIFLESCHYLVRILNGKKPVYEVVFLLKKAFKEGSDFRNFCYKNHYFKSCNISLPSFFSDKYDEKICPIIENICVTNAQTFIQQNQSENFSIQRCMSLVIWLANHLLFEGKEKFVAIYEPLVLDVVKVALKVLAALNSECFQMHYLTLLDALEEFDYQVPKTRLLWHRYQSHQKDNYDKNCKRLIIRCSEALLKSCENSLTSGIEEMFARECVYKYANLCANTAGYEKDWFLAETPLATMPPAILAWSSLKTWYTDKSKINYFEVLLNIEKALENNNPYKQTMSKLLSYLMGVFPFRLLDGCQHYNIMNQETVENTVTKERDIIKKEQADERKNLLSFLINEEEKLLRDNIDADEVAQRSELVKQEMIEKDWDIVSMD